MAASALAQNEPVEYTATPLSDTLTMIKGSGGNIAVSAGEAKSEFFVWREEFPQTSRFAVAPGIGATGLFPR